MKKNFPGDLLAGKRDQLGLELDKVFKDINISKKYLQALECDNIEVFPSLTYYTGYLKIYAEYLNLDFQELYKNFKTLQRERESVPLKELTTPQPRWLLFLTITLIVCIAATTIFFVMK